MKVLIWVGCFIVASILNTILGYMSGIKAGYLVFYLAVFFVARKLCSKWDEYKAKKNAPLCVCRKCGNLLPEDAAFCNQCGTEV